MFGDDDDEEPQFEVVDEYYFEEGENVPVCFSVLALQFAENDEVACCDSKKVDLRGRADNGRYTVHKKVVAWRVGLDSEQPKISVLSSEGNRIKLSKPRKCYIKTVRSILITVQMLHFVRRQPSKHKKSLLVHLCKGFNKFNIKRAEDDLRKHQSLIMLFADRDPTLTKSKILQRFIEDTSGEIKEPKKSTGTKEPLIVSDESLASSNDDFGDYDESLASSNDDDGDYDESLAISNDDDGDYDYKGDNSDDDYSYSEDDSDDDDDNGDGDTDNDDDDGGGGTDPVCAICDNGEKLLR